MCRNGAGAFEQMKNITEQVPVNEDNTDRLSAGEKEGAGDPYAYPGESVDDLRWKINGSWVEYSPEAGSLTVDRDAFQTKPWQHELLLIIDDRSWRSFLRMAVRWEHLSCAVRK